MTETKKAPKKTTNTYKAELTVMGKKFTSSGKTAEEAIQKLDIGNSKGRGVLVMKHGDKTKESVLMPFMVSRVFQSRGLAQEVAIKNLSLLFD